jgi:SPP1 gp7 family putative phage head morphogenesis protein
MAEDFIPNSTINYINKAKKDITKSLVGSLVKKYANEIDDGVKAGLSSKQIADNLRKKDSSIKSKTIANTIARTLLHGAYARGSITDMLEDEMIVAFRFNAVNDSRVSDICESLDGKIISKDEVYNFLPPLHYNCRSVLEPIFINENIPPDKLINKDTYKTKEYQEKIEPLMKKQESFLKYQREDIELMREEVKQEVKEHEVPKVGSTDEVKKMIAETKIQNYTDAINVGKKINDYLDTNINLKKMREDKLNLKIEKETLQKKAIEARNKFDISTELLNKEFDKLTEEIDNINNEIFSLTNTIQYLETNIQFTENYIKRLLADGVQPDSYNIKLQKEDLDKDIALLKDRKVKLDILNNTIQSQEYIKKIAFKDKLEKELDKMNDDFNKLFNSYSDRIDEILKESKKINDTIMPEMLNSLKTIINFGAIDKDNNNYMPKFSSDSNIDAVNIFKQISDAIPTHFLKIIAEDTNNTKLLNEPQRASYNSGEKRITVDIASKDIVNALIHEFFHRVEHANENILLAQKNFYDERTKSDKKEQLKSYPGFESYSAFEFIKKDKWKDIYIGKDYNSTGYEILSMIGSSILTGDQDNIYNFDLDPEARDFALGIISGAEIEVK